MGNSAERDAASESRRRLDELLERLQRFVELLPPLGEAIESARRTSDPDAINSKNAWTAMILHLWKAHEWLIEVPLREQAGADVVRMLAPVAQLVDKYASMGVLSTDEAGRLRRLLKTRNDNAHLPTDSDGLQFLGWSTLKQLLEFLEQRYSGRRSARSYLHLPEFLDQQRTLFQLLQPLGSPWLFGGADDITRVLFEEIELSPPPTMLLIGPEIDRYLLGQTTFDRIETGTDGIPFLAPFDDGNSDSRTNVDYSLDKALCMLATKLKLDVVLVFSEYARDALTSADAPPILSHCCNKWEYLRALNEGRIPLVDGTLRTDDLQPFSRGRLVTPFADWQIEVIDEHASKRAIMIGFSARMYGIEIAERLHLGLKPQHPDLLIFANDSFGAGPKASAEQNRQANIEQRTKIKAAKHLYPESLEEHVKVIFTLGQIAKFHETLGRASSLVGLRPPASVLESLLRRYENLMATTCGGGNFEVIQEQIPLSAWHETTAGSYQTLLEALASDARLHRVLLIAPAGSGKSTQLLFVASEMARFSHPEFEPIAQWHRVQAGDNRLRLVSKIPLLMRAQEIAPLLSSVGRMRTEDYLVDIVADLFKLRSEDTKALPKFFENGDVLLLIDSIDELDVRTAEEVLGFFWRVLEKYPRCPAVVASRILDAVPQHMALFPKLTLDPLPDHLVQSYVAKRWEFADEAPGLAQLAEQISGGVRESLEVLRQPMILRMFCDALDAPSSRLDNIPTDRAGIYEQVLSTVFTAHVARLETVSSGLDAEAHFTALTRVAEHMNIPSRDAIRRHVAGIPRSDLESLLARAFVDVAPTLAGATAELGRLVASYISLKDESRHSGLQLFEALPGGHLRFSHRSVLEFLTAKSLHEALRSRSSVEGAELARVRARMADLGDDGETFRFFAGLLLRGSSQWERQASISILDGLLKNDGEAMRFLQLLGDAGNAASDASSAGTAVWSRFLEHELQRDIGLVIERESKRKRDRPSELVGLLEPFLRVRPRNPFLMHFAVEALERLENTSPLAAPLVRSTLDALWAEASQPGVFTEPVRASDLKEWADVWAEGTAVPRPWLVEIPAGDVAVPDRPPRPVEAFYIAETLTTRAQWDVFRTGVCWDRSALAEPQTRVIWQEANIFARWLFGEWGNLPTRTQWLRAARGASDDDWLWPDTTDVITVANTASSGIGGPSRVDRYPPQGTFGLRDLVGNLLEWTNTWFRDILDQADDPEPEPERGYARMLQGGSFNHAPAVARMSVRFPSAPENFVNVIGMRVCIEKEKYEKWLSNGQR